MLASDRGSPANRPTAARRTENSSLTVATRMGPLYSTDPVTIGSAACTGYCFPADVLSELVFPADVVIPVPATTTALSRAWEPEAPQPDSGIIYISEPVQFWFEPATWAAMWKCAEPVAPVMPVADCLPVWMFYAAPRCRGHRASRRVASASSASADDGSSPAPPVRQLHLADFAGAALRPRAVA